MTLDIEGVVDGGVRRRKSLGRTGGFENLHAPLSLPDWQIGANWHIRKIIRLMQPDGLVRIIESRYHLIN